jgi:hypothetical protein
MGWVAVLLLCPGYVWPAEISGVYELKEKGVQRTLEIREHKGMGTLQFTLYVQAGGFTGAMFGLADLKGNTATYQKKDCKLTITFGGNKAVISQADTHCRDYLKPGLLLEGTYLRKP